MAKRANGRPRLPAKKVRSVNFSFNLSPLEAERVAKVRAEVEAYYRAETGDPNYSLSHSEFGRRCVLEFAAVLALLKADRDAGQAIVDHRDRLMAENASLKRQLNSFKARDSAKGNAPVRRMMAEVDRKKAEVN